MKVGFLVCLGLVFLAGCSDLGIPPEAEPFGIFAVSLQDTLGVTRATGHLVLVDADSMVVGSWSLVNGQNGRLVGMFSEGRLEINLNPEFIDNNLLLFGTFTGEGYSGHWMHLGFGGVMDRGFFLAVKRRLQREE